jgi:hypothetical protein
MILFAWFQGHARRQVQGIIGVSPVSWFPPTATIESVKADFASESFTDFQPSYRDTGGTPMILYARPQGHVLGENSLEHSSSSRHSGQVRDLAPLNA